MQRLHVNRYILGWTLIALWLVPAGLHQAFFSNWLEQFDEVWESVTALRNFVTVPAPVASAINAIALLLGPLLVLICEPAPPVSARQTAILPEQRFRAGLVDFAAAQLAIALPAQLLLLTLNEMQLGQPFDPDWIGLPRLFLEPFSPVAWLIYTGWHLTRRKQTLGQYVNRYRLVHPGPVTSAREVVYQVFRIWLHAAGQAARDSLRHQRSILTYTKAEYAALDETVTPNWYFSAGVTTEVLDYDAGE
ncbi:hypothetical protein [Maricaulis sp.]|uniref:hypothetical protein n=1 Tax=Maricaulis sp. TaxID=1486257 RepID=UPI002B266623|nr:hypothetical protein [Maricaulis sp.]